MEAKSQSLVSVPNIPGLNPKSLRSVFDVKANTQLEAILPLDGDVKTGGPLITFEKNRLMLAPGFPFIFLTSYSSLI